jgi:hypothetical protein
MSRRLTGIVVAAVSFALGALVVNRPAAVNAQPAGNAKGKCVGLTAMHVPLQALIFRAFDDGTTEVTSLDPKTGRYRPYVKTAD